MSVQADKNGITLGNWLDQAKTDPALVSALDALADAAFKIAKTIRTAPLLGQTGAANAVNVQGEDQKLLDVISNDISVAALSASPHVAAIVSEEIEDVIQNPNAGAGAGLVVCLDPLDGSSNIETNSAIGTIFSVLATNSAARPVTEAAVLAATNAQRAAGYVLYGPATLLVLTLGKTVAMFAEDAANGEFVLVRDNITIARKASEFAINMAHRRHWEPAVTAYIDALVEGETGPRGKPFNMRWAGSMVADVHRLFVRGGIFIYPALQTPGGANGKLRLLYEAIPMAMLVETAGGKAIAGKAPLNTIIPKSLHQRVPLALGSAEEVERLMGGYE